MRRLTTSALAAAVLAVGAGEAQAQDMMGRRASAFELGIYAGGAYTTSWFTTPGTAAAGDEDIDWAPGLSPIFGATAAFFFTPSFGLRLHGAYMPQNLPQEEGVFEIESDYVVNSYLYDLDLVFRPWITTGNGWMADTYFFLGGGGYTANIAGQAPHPGCLRITVWVANGICQSVNPTISTTGQGVIGVGSTFMPLMGLGLFGELAVHGYDSPSHGPDEDNTQLRGRDRFTFTPRAVLGLKAMFGNLIPPPPVVDMAPPPLPPVAPPPVAQPVDATREIQVCVVDGGSLRNVSARYNTQTGDTTVNGQRFSTAYPSGTGYAAGATWYINTEPIMVNGRRYVKYGLPRVLGTNEVTRVGEYQGVSVFAEAGATGTPEVLYVPVRTGCEFQPYQLEVKAGAVRGEE